MKRALLILAALTLPLPADAQSAPPPTTRAVQAGFAAGFTDCAGPLDAAVKFVHEDDQAYAQLGTWSKDNPNGEAFNTVTSERLPGGQSVTSFTGVKTASGKCDTLFTQVLAVPAKSCEALAKTSFKGWKYYSDLNGAAVYEDPTSPSVNVILIATSKTSCVIVKQATMLGG